MFIEQINYIYFLIIIIPLLLFLYKYSNRKRKSVLKNFNPSIISLNKNYYLLKTFLILLVFIFSIISLTKPKYGYKLEKLFSSKSNILNRRWLEEFGGLLGLRVDDLLEINGIEEKHLIAYRYPSDEELSKVGVTGLFLGYYVPWDGYQNALISQANGFTTYPNVVEGSFVNYENLDNYQTGIHDYFKFLKFGFGRATDIASLHIRRGRISRELALELVKKLDGKFPWTYLGFPLENNKRYRCYI